VQVHCGDGVVTHTGPEPCAGTREGTGEASVGERTGQPLSREIRDVLGADAFDNAQCDTGGRVITSARTARRGRRTWHVRTLFAREPGDLASGRREKMLSGPHRKGEEP
jgi:hypothetical protein